MKFLRFSEVHKPNGYAESQKKTAQTEIYEKAEKKLRHRTFAEKWNPIKETIIKIRNCYPIISVGLGGVISFGGAFLMSENYPFIVKVISGIILGAFGMGIISIAEALKLKSAKEVFAESNKVMIPVLIMFFGFSLLVSALGGYVGTVVAGDMSDQIKTDYTAKTDSIRQMYMNQIADYDLIIEQNRQKIAKGGKWNTYHGRKDLAEAQTAKSELLGKIKTDSKELATAQNTEISKADELLKYKAYIICVLVLVMEVFYIVSFWFEYYVERRIKTENRNHNFIPHSEYDAPIDTAPIASPSNGMDLQNMMHTLQQLQNLQIALNNFDGNTPNVTPNHTPSNEPQKVGFQFVKSDVKRPR